MLAPLRHAPPRLSAEHVNPTAGRHDPALLRGRRPLLDGWEHWTKTAVHVADGDPHRVLERLAPTRRSHPERMAAVWATSTAPPNDAS